MKLFRTVLFGWLCCAVLCLEVMAAPFLITSGHLSETFNGGLPYGLDFAWSGSNFSITGVGATSEPPCSLPCMTGTTTAVDDSISTEDRGFSGIITISGVQYPYAGLPGLAFGAGMDFLYMLPIPMVVGPFPDSLSMTSPFSMSGGAGGPGVPDVSFQGSGTASVNLSYFPAFPGDNEYRLQSVVYTIGSVPEPGTFLLLGIGIVSVIVKHRRATLTS